MTHGKLGGITVAVLAELGVGEGDGKWQLLVFKRRGLREEPGKSMAVGRTVGSPPVVLALVVCIPGPADPGSRGHVVA